MSKHVLELSEFLFAGDEKLTLVVEGSYQKAQPAYYGGEMAPIDPPEPASFEIVSAGLLVAGKVVPFPLGCLSESQMATLEATCCDEVGELE